MKEEIKITEDFKIQDSCQKPRGLVCFEDSSGNIIFKKENMIVEDGRKFLFSLFKNTLSEPDPEAINYELYKIQIGRGIAPTTPNMVLNDIEDDNIIDVLISNVDVAYNENGLGLAISIPLSGNDVSEAISNISLILRDTAELYPTTDVLFSRVVFSPYLIGNGNINIKYYINF